MPQIGKTVSLITFKKDKNLTLLTINSNHLAIVPPYCNLTHIFLVSQHLVCPQGLFFVIAFTQPNTGNGLTIYSYTFKTQIL